MDFTKKTYINLLETLKERGYSFQTFEDYVKNPHDKVVVLRHDVDKLPQNAVNLADIESKLGIKASYYYRIVKQSNIPNLIEKVRDMGHEIGYHYEDLTLAKGDKERAIKMFETNLSYFRKFYPVKTACMHGSPLSKWDNRDLWKKYSYKDFGIIAEPYFDVNYNEVFYITDTGRHWNNSGVSIRDKVKTKYNFEVKSTPHFINLVKNDVLPQKIIINTHPQRWCDPGFNWLKELIIQNIKNQIKKLL